MANNQKRKIQRAVIPGRSIDPKTGLKELDTIWAAIAGVRLHKLVRIKHKSPWLRFQKDFEIKLQVFSDIAIHREPPREFVIIKSFSCADAPKTVNMLKKIQDDNFVTFLEYFRLKRLII